MRNCERSILPARYRHKQTGNQDGKNESGLLGQRERLREPLPAFVTGNPHGVRLRINRNSAGSSFVWHVTKRGQFAGFNGRDGNLALTAGATGKVQAGVVSHFVNPRAGGHSRRDFPLERSNQSSLPAPASRRPLLSGTMAKPCGPLSGASGHDSRSLLRMGSITAMVVTNFSPSDQSPKLHQRCCYIHKPAPS